MVDKNYNERINHVFEWFNGKPTRITGNISYIKKCTGELNDEIIKLAKNKFKTKTEPVVADEDLTMFLTFIKKNKITSIEDLSNRFELTVAQVKENIGILNNSGYDILIDSGQKVYIDGIKSGGVKKVDLTKNSPSDLTEITYRFGYITDEHLGSKYERLDVVRAAYEEFSRQGIDTVYNTGNWIDGVINFNKNDIHVHSMESQIDYFIQNYPQVEGINMYYIAGEDHEGWFTRREGINIGKYLELKAFEAGRTDLHHLGFMEADVHLESSNGKCVLRLIHPGGGSSYAVSYKPQKIVESYTSGEKPNILLVGHYHKAGYFYNRGVHVVLGGCAVDQTPFMRKNNLAAHVGFWIIEVSLDKNGAVTRFNPVFHPFYDKDYYDEETWKYIF